MDKKEFLKRKNEIVNNPTQALLLLAEVVNDGVLAMEAMYDYFTNSDNDSSDVTPLGDALDPNATLADDPEATLDERAPINARVVQVRQEDLDDIRRY